MLQATVHYTYTNKHIRIIGETVCEDGVTVVLSSRLRLTILVQTVLTWIRRVLRLSRLLVHLLDIRPHRQLQDPRPVRQIQQYVLEVTH